MSANRVEGGADSVVILDKSAPKNPQPQSAKDLGRVATTCIEHAYGSAVRLSFQIKVF
jgi:hypothetical protein